MKRIAECHQDYFYDIENASKYLKDAKNVSKARFSDFSVLHAIHFDKKINICMCNLIFNNLKVGK